MTALALPSITNLAGVLVRISRECEAPIEHLRAEQLVREAREAWPGEETDSWSKWLSEACRCLESARVREAELSVEEARHLAEDGAAVVGLWREGVGPIVLISEGEVAEGEIDDRHTISADGEFEEAVVECQSPLRWLVVEHAGRFDVFEQPRSCRINPSRGWCSF